MIAEFESRILALIDNMVDHASDDELFAGGYLRGHLTLAVAGSWKVRASILLTRYGSKVSQSWRKPSALANCRRRTKFWCRGCGKTCICRQKIRPDHVVARSRRQPYREIACPHGLFHRFSLQQFFSPTADSDSAPPEVSLSSGSGSRAHLRRQQLSA